MTSRFVQKTFYRVRASLHEAYSQLTRRPWWRLQGMSVGHGTVLPALQVNWPHRVSIGRRCSLERDIFFKIDGVWAAGRAIEIGDGAFIGRGTEFNVIDKVRIGADSLIGSGCKFIDHNHGIAPDLPIGTQQLPHAPITLGAGVWLGVNVVVLQGVSIGEGAVIGAGSVVTRSVPANEIWAGVPARRLGSRADSVPVR